jgi:hypothetical protein
MVELVRQVASQRNKAIFSWGDTCNVKMEQQIQEASNFNPLALAMLIGLSCLTWSLPRRFAICPLLVMTCLMPLGQELVLLGLHFHLFRILLLVGMMRVAAKGEASRMEWTRMDKLFAWWVIVSVVFGSLSKPSMDLFINRLGDFYNAVGCYFFVRCVIVEFEDIVTSVQTLAWLSMAVAVLMLVEKITAHNMLSVFGGVPPITFLREGHLRCQGAFRHPILAGTFGATQFPLFVALWLYPVKPRWLGLAAVFSSMIIVVAASSSGALMALFAGMAGLMLWKWRGHMRTIRRGAVVMILGLALVMKAPVWYLFAKLSDVTGGTGWHRAFLIDQTIAHFDEWWLFGTTYTAHWGPAGQVIAADTNMMDITNQFVAEGVDGGLLKLVLFVAIIVGCFKILGRQLHVEEVKSPATFFVWAIGVSLFAHCLSFMSITYFDQSIVIWYWLLAVISSLNYLRFTGLFSNVTA